MKNNKGITLVSLIGYVILAIMALAVLVALTTNFKKNFGELDVQAVQDIELDKINMQISKDIKDGKKVDKTNFSSTKLAFIDGNTYTYVSKDKTLYMNNNVAVAEHLKSCIFELPNDDILRVTAQVEDKTRTMEFSIGGNYVARIEKTYYKTLQSAIDAVPANNVETTITILTDISENTTIAQNQNIVLDIGIWTIKNRGDNSVITTSGKLKIKNGAITSDTTKNLPIIWNKEGALLNITGGTIKSDESIALGNEGNLEISGTTKIDGKSGISNKKNGKVRITGGELISRGGNTINSYGTVEISDSAKIMGDQESQTYDGYSVGYPTIYNQEIGKVIITGGIILSENSNTINNSGNLEISGNPEIIGTADVWELEGYTEIQGVPTIINKNNGTVKISGGIIKSTNIQALSNNISSTAIIAGGKLISENSNAVRNAGTLEIQESAKIDGVTSNNPTFVNDVGAIAIIKGSVTSAKSHAINNEGIIEIEEMATIEGTGDFPTVWNKANSNMTITGATVTSANSYAINNLATLEINGTTTIKSLATENIPAIANRSGGNITINAGNITAVGSNAFWNLAGATATITGGTLRSENSNVIRNYGEIEISGNVNIARSASSYPTFSNESGAIARITGGTITSTETNAIWNKTGATATITGGNISSTASNPVYNDGTVTIGGTAIINGSTTLDTKPAIYNKTNATASITGGTINGNLSRAIYSEKTSVLNISGGNISSSNQYTVISKGAMTITGGRISNTNTNNYAVYNWTSEGGTCTMSGATILGKTYGI